MRAGSESLDENLFNRPPLTETVRRQLLFLARQSIADALFRTVTAPFVAVDSDARFKSGAFVTIYEDEKLRGCIGMVEALENLPLVVMEMAMAAATRDPRFEPVAPEELVKLEIEISVLSKLHPIESPEEIEIGKHGVLLRADGHQGLLLPQVATSAGWSAEELLSATCRKASLPKDRWQKPDCETFIFSAEIFAEADFREA